MKNNRKQLMANKNGITLIALVITIIILLILAGISISTLTGDNGILTMARKAEKEHNEAEEKEQMDLDNLAELADSFANPPVTYPPSSNPLSAAYNGKLSIKDGQIINQHGESLVLRGMSAVNGSGINSLKDTWYNSESLANINKMGANVFRIPVDTAPHYKGYAGLNEADRATYRAQVWKIAKYCIKADMYVIIDWHTLNEANPNTYIDEAKDFFTKMQEEYKKDESIDEQTKNERIIYEICNEPGQYVPWSKSDSDIKKRGLKEYAEDIIPVITDNGAKNPIIITGTPAQSHNVDAVIGNKLDYENAMYSFHIYTTWLETRYMKSLEAAVNNNIPVFVTEWGPTSETKIGGFHTESANMITNYMKKHNISWTNWNLSDGAEEFALVQPGKWNSSLDDDILSRSGKYVKELLNNEPQEDYPIMMDRPWDPTLGGPIDNYAFWLPEYRSNITSIIVENKIDQQKISAAKESWDVSYMKENPKKVMAYIEEPDKNEKYILYLAGDGGVCAPPNSRWLFDSFPNLEKVDFSNFKTGSTHCMGAMLANSPKLTEVNLSTFDTTSVREMDYMFVNCSNLTNITFPTSETKLLYTTACMFQNCTSLNTIDLSGFKSDRITASANYRDMFKDIKDNPTIIVKDEDARTFIQTRIKEAGKTANIVLKSEQP